MKKRLGKEDEYTGNAEDLAPPFEDVAVAGLSIGTSLEEFACKFSTLEALEGAHDDLATLSE